MATMLDLKGLDTQLFLLKVEFPSVTAEGETRVGGSQDPIPFYQIPLVTLSFPLLVRFCCQLEAMAILRHP